MNCKKCDQTVFDLSTRSLKDIPNGLKCDQREPSPMIMGKKYYTNMYGDGFTVHLDNSSYSYISISKDAKHSLKYALAHELAGHAIPGTISPSDYDPRFDGLAVTAENIIRGETGEPLREWGDYEKNDWAVGSKANSLFRVYLGKLCNLIK